MSSEVVISAKGVSKSFAVFKRPEDRLKQILFRNKRRFYEHIEALKPIDIEIKRGETVGLVGRNGSGKSTFLHLVCGTLQPNSGQINVTGRVAALLELGAGFNPEFTGMENIYMSASILGLEKSEIDARLDDILDFADIGKFVDMPVKVYSSGMYARLAFSVAAHVDADILIVDEILAVGDAAFGQKCMRFIQKFKENGTLLFVSHDAAAVNNLCDRAIWLDYGEVKQIGSAKEVTRQYLASLYELDHNAGVSEPDSDAKPIERSKPDVRAELLETSNLRNNIEVFDFDLSGSWFGKQGAEILDAKLVDSDGMQLAFLTGGEAVSMVIKCQAHIELDQPIIGFLVNDRLGQTLFGDNTFLTYCFEPKKIMAGQMFTAKFSFDFPYLPSGDYSVTIAIANGTQASHEQHHWIHEAIIVKVVTSHVARGLVGVPMHDIVIEGEGV